MPTPPKTLRTAFALARLLRPGLAGAASLALTACSGPPYPNGTLDELFPGGPRPTLTTVSVQGQQLGVARMDHGAHAATKTPVLLFVHGSPGSWKAWAHYLRTPELAAYPLRMAVDRPGFGLSLAGGVVPDLRRQAALLTDLIPPGRKAIVIGHSLGGPLAAWMAIDAPDRVCGVLSIAGSLASTYEAPRWYNRLADSALLRWAVPNEMTASNQEMMPLSTELARLEAALPQIRVPFTVMQGDQDALVDPRTADEVQRRVPKAWLRVQRLPNEGHFVLWEKPALVTEAIRSLACE